MRPTSVSMFFSTARWSAGFDIVSVVLSDGLRIGMLIVEGSLKGKL